MPPRPAKRAAAVPSSDNSENADNGADGNKDSLPLAKRRKKDQEKISNGKSANSKSAGSNDELGSKDKKPTKKKATETAKLDKKPTKKKATEATKKTTNGEATEAAKSDKKTTKKKATETTKTTTKKKVTEATKSAKKTTKKKSDERTESSSEESEVASEPEEAEMPTKDVGSVKKQVAKCLSRLKAGEDIYDVVWDVPYEILVDVSKATRDEPNDDTDADRQIQAVIYTASKIDTEIIKRIISCIDCDFECKIRLY